MRSGPRTPAHEAFARHQSWSVSTPAAAPLLRTDVYLCGDVVQWVAPAVLVLSPARRADLHLRHTARLADLHTDWDRLERVLSSLTALQPYAVGLGIVWTTSLVGHAAMQEGPLGWATLEAAGGVWGVQGAGLALSVVGAAARRGLKWWLRRRMRRAVATWTAGRRTSGHIPGPPDLPTPGPHRPE